MSDQRKKNRYLILKSRYIHGGYFRRKRWLFIGCLLLGICWILWSKILLIINEPEEKSLWYEDFKKPHLNPHRFNLLINAPSVCPSKENVILLVLVASSVNHSDRRNAIRSTWGSPKWTDSRNIKVVFLLGHVLDKQADIYNEAIERKDIVQEDFKDTYYNLTLKTIMGLKWASIYCPQAKFVMKTDDDIFINIPALHQALDRESESYFQNNIVGCVKNDPRTAPQPIPASPDLPPLPPAHPAFTAGAGYILPGGNFVRDLYIASLETKFFPIEDVYTTAHLARKLKAHPPKHDLRFSCGEMSQVSYNANYGTSKTYCRSLKNKFTEHKVPPEHMRVLVELAEVVDC